MTRALVFLLAALLPALSADAAPGVVPPGWMVAGMDPQHYEFGTAPIEGAQGKMAAYVKARPDAPANGFGTLTQCIRADNYLGQRIRLAARLKTIGAGAGRLWLRVDGGREMLSLYNMAEKPLTGTTDWQREDAVLDVPANATGICYGFLLSFGRGEVWADALSLEKVDRSVPISQMVPNEPVNLGFEK